MRKTTLLIAMLFASVAMMAQTLTVEVDMQPAIDNGDYGFTQTSGTVVLAGSFNGWTEPGQDGTVYMENIEGTTKWTASVSVDGSDDQDTDTDGFQVKFKVFVLDNDSTPSWDYGDNEAGDRLLTVDSDVITKVVWGDPTTVDVPTNKLSEVAVYPNPFVSELNVDNLEGVKEIRIANMLGQNVMVVKDVEMSEVIATSHLENGIYLISIVDNNNNVRTERVVKQ